ncbi:DUF2553 family protein [Evansella halocellulosilytica]|uniref:DUF2553 family protein n=1 Tax=Evansella halocellulosilytica TaxID=2011013 RepID=UPI000BB7031E|nr:DUF2553 family protein [Evansella halocellulosilytica]
MANKRNNEVNGQEVYHQMGDNVNHPTVDESLVNDATKHESKSRIEVTDQVKRQEEESGETNFYLGDEKIGKMKQAGQTYQYEMAEGFEFDNEKFYKKDAKKQPQPQSYVEGCDMGWC